jgi:gamma-glutamyltranspeptidase/glutathione hydrolase
MAPPSSGGIAIAQSLGILENFDLSQYGPANPSNEGGVPSVMGVHLVSEAERLAYADRDKYVADTDFVPLPGNGVSSMIDKAYLKQRAALISAGNSMGTATAGNLGDMPQGVDKTVEKGTTHFSIVDAYGNVVSMTTTVESSMGSFHMVGGFLLTNQLTDFSAQPTDSAGLLVANRVAPASAPQHHGAHAGLQGHRPWRLPDGHRLAGRRHHHPVRAQDRGGRTGLGLDAQQATSLVNIGATNSPTTNVDGSNTTLDLTA